MVPARKVFLGDVWPANEHITVFVCLGTPSGTSWVFKGFADTPEGEEAFNAYQHYLIESSVPAGSRMMYLYLDETYQRQSGPDVIDENQTTLF